MSRFISFLFIPAIAMIAACVAYLATKDGDYFLNQEPFGAKDIAALSAEKVIVITGASSGLGMSSAKLLVEAGTAHTVVMACRNMKKCNHAMDTILASTRDGCKVSLMTAQLDLASLDSVKSFASSLQRRLLGNVPIVNSGVAAPEEVGAVPKIDILINNAGIMGVEYSLHSQTNVELQMHVNHLGHFALTSLLRKNLMEGGRVVSVSSLAAAPPMLNLDDVNFTTTWIRKWLLKHMKLAQQFAAYCASKRANLVFTHALNEKYAPSSSSSQGIIALSAHPGYSRTSIVYNGWTGFPHFVKDLCASHTLSSMSSDEGALPQLRAALDVDHVKGGDYVGPLFFLKGRPVIVGTCLKSFHHLFWPIHNAAKVSEDLWSWSEDAIGWKFHDGPV